MRRLTATIWCLLLLIPYLCGAVIGEIPHVHNHCQGQALLTLNVQTHTLVFAEAGVVTDAGESVRLSSNAANDDCPLCRLNAVIAAGAIPAISLPSLPPVSHLQTAHIPALRTPVTPALRNSRAPPAGETV